MTEERRVSEDDRGYLLARANGGHKLHILPPTWKQFGNDTKALCGHQPNNSSYNMRRRGKWLHTATSIGLGVTCEKCARAYEKLLEVANHERNLDEGSAEDRARHRRRNGEGKQRRVRAFERLRRIRALRSASAASDAAEADQGVEGASAAPNTDERPNPARDA